MTRREVSRALREEVKRVKDWVAEHGAEAGLMGHELWAFKEACSYVLQVLSEREATNEHDG